MPAGVAAAALFAAMGSLARWRTSRDWTWLAVSVLTFGGTVGLMGRDGLRLAVVAGPASGSLLFAGVVMGLLFWASALGLPRPLALSLGIGLTSRPLRFCNRVRADWEQLHRAVQDAVDHPDKREARLAQARIRLERLRAIRPPDDAWAGIRDELADGFDAMIELLRRGEPAERLADAGPAAAAVTQRWAIMVEAAAADQRRLRSPQVIRRGRITWLVAAGASVLLAGVAGLSVDGGLTGAPAGVRLWVDLAEICFGMALLLGALIVPFSARRPGDIQ